MARLKLLAVFAHPDDESLGVGGTLAKYAAEGVEVSLVTATRGQRGRYKEHRFGTDQHPGPDALGRLPEAELRAAAEVLGIRELILLDYDDGSLDGAVPREAIGEIVAHVRRIQPDVVITFGPEGAYGHPDHIAICSSRPRPWSRRRTAAPTPGKYRSCTTWRRQPRRGRPTSTRSRS
jgi:LmbE family N-acetylglucosaminyl deacetylase